MTNGEAFVQRSARTAESILADEVYEAMWAHFGQLVHGRIVGPDLIEVLTRAGLKSKTTKEMAAYIRTYILTGAKP